MAGLFSWEGNKIPGGTDRGAVSEIGQLPES
jgi:hypothetical protein